MAKIDKIDIKFTVTKEMKDQVALYRSMIPKTDKRLIRVIGISGFMYTYTDCFGEKMLKDASMSKYLGKYTCDDYDDFCIIMDARFIFGLSEFADNTEVILHDGKSLSSGKDTIYTEINPVMSDYREEGEPDGALPDICDLIETTNKDLKNGIVHHLNVHKEYQELYSAAPSYIDEYIKKNKDANGDFQSVLLTRDGYECIGSKTEIIFKKSKEYSGVSTPKFASNLDEDVLLTQAGNGHVTLKSKSLIYYAFDKVTPGDIGRTLCLALHPGVERDTILKTMCDPCGTRKDTVNAMCRLDPGSTYLDAYITESEAEEYRKRLPKKQAYINFYENMMFLTTQEGRLLQKQKMGDIKDINVHMMSMNANLMFAYGIGKGRIRVSSLSTTVAVVSMEDESAPRLLISAMEQSPACMFNTYERDVKEARHE